MPTTVKDKIDYCNPAEVLQYLSMLRDTAARQAGTITPLGLGAILAALRPRNRTRTGLASSATQVHDEACIIYAVQGALGTPLAQISGGSPGAGEVSVDYNATTGVPTLIFNVALTEYTVHCSGALPQNIATVMATVTGQ